MNIAVDEHRFQFSEEMRIVPWWAIGLAAGVFIGVQVVLNFFVTHEHNPPPISLRIVLGLSFGLVLAFYVLMIGYVNVNAGRRGMNRALWTLLVIFIPNAIGFILYFLFRHPLRLPCPRCGSTTRRGFNFCPSCSYALHPACPKCKSPVRESDAFCPYCAANLALLNHSETRP